MAKFFFFSVPAYGHINANLSLVRELVSRGHQVIYFCREDFRACIEKSGCEFREIPYEFSNFNAKTPQHIQKSLWYKSLGYVWHHGIPFLAKLARKNPDYLLHTVVETAAPGFDLLNSVLRSLPEMIRQCHEEKPDCIIEDSMSPYGRFLRHILSIPTIVTWPNPLIDALYWWPRPLLSFILWIRKPKAMYSYKVLARQLAQHYDMTELSLDDLFFRNRGDIDIAFTDKSWQPFKEKYGDTCKYVGISLPEDDLYKESFPFYKLQDKKLVYISIGTVNNDNIPFYRKCVQALGGNAFNVVMSIGDKLKITDIINPEVIPENFFIFPYVPRPDILKMADVFITHGTGNSIAESIFYKVPILLHPQAFDQNFIASEAIKQGLGLLLRKRFTSSELAYLVNSMIVNKKKYLSNITLLRSKLLGGHTRAADEIQNFLKNLPTDTPEKLISQTSRISRHGL